MSGVWKGISYWANRRPSPPPPVAPPPERPAVGEAAFLQALPVATIQGFNPWGIYCHAWHESGQFAITNPLVQVFNYWGITKSSIWDGEVVHKPTKEFLSGAWINTTRDFQAWPNANVAMAWYCEKLIKRVYPLAWEKRGEIVGYFIELARRGHATHPHYTHKI